LARDRGSCRGWRSSSIGNNRERELRRQQDEDDVGSGHAVRSITLPRRGEASLLILIGRLTPESHRSRHPGAAAAA